MQPQQPYPYPPQPQYPVYPQGPAYAPAPVYPPAAQYPQQYPAPVAPTTPGSLDAFYDQPGSGGGPSFKFMDANRNPQLGKTYAGIVARPITNADVRQQTDQTGRPMTFKDGRPKFVMVVPMLVQPSPEFPEGTAGWWVKGQARDELARAMAEAGAPEGPPEPGAAISVTLTGTRPIPGFNPQYLYRVVYRRPDGAAAPVQQTQPQAPQYAPAPQQPVGQQPMVAQPYGPDPGGQIVNPVTAPAPQPTAQPQPAMAHAPSGLTPEEQALLAKLTGG